jgi:hypothetical protein
MKILYITLLTLLLNITPSYAIDMSHPSAGRMQIAISWCHQGHASDSLFQQGSTLLPRGVCGAYLAAATVTFSGIGADVIIYSPQHEIIKIADTLACARNSVSDQLAIRIAQVCQCHNTSAVDFIENNQDVAAYILRRHGGCEDLN